MAYIADTQKITPREADIAGISIFVGFLVLVFIYAGYNLFIKKWWRCRRDGDPLLKGTVRWAAAAGDLQTLEAISLNPRFDVESAIDGYTALHAAVVGGHRGRKKVNTRLFFFLKESEANIIEFLSFLQY